MNFSRRISRKDEKGRGKLNENWKFFADRFLRSSKIERSWREGGSLCANCLTLTGHVIERGRRWKKKMRREVFVGIHDRFEDTMTLHEYEVK